MLNKADFIKAGIVAKPHGVSGETALRLLPQMEPHELHPTFVYILIDGGLVPFRVESFRYKTDDVLLVRLPLLPTPEKIRSFMDCDVYIAPDEIERSAPQLIRSKTLIGYRLKDVTHGDVGVVADIHEITGNPLFVVKHQKGEVLIPATEDFVVDIDDEMRVITVEIPEGLLGINE